MSYPANLKIAPEPSWFVRLTAPDGTRSVLTVRDRTSWQRLTALCHARYFAVRHPDYLVEVDLA